MQGNSDLRHYQMRSRGDSGNPLFLPHPRGLIYWSLDWAVMDRIICISKFEGRTREISGGILVCLDDQADVLFEVAESMQARVASCSHLIL